MREQEQKPHEKKQVRSTPTSEPKAARGPADAEGLSGNLIATNEAAAIPTHAKQLGDAQVQTAQRQAMAANIGQVGSNRYLQQVISQMQQEKTPPPAPQQPQKQAPTQPEAAEQPQEQAQTQPKAPTATPEQPPSQAQAQAQSAAPQQSQAQKHVTPRQPDQIGARIEALRGMPPTGQITAAAQAGQEIPDLWAKERQATLETVPSAPKSPIGIPTLEEATGQSTPPQEAATETGIVAPETPEVRSAPEQPSDPKAEGQEFLRESQAAAEAQDREEQARHPEHAQTRRHTNTSAGERPKANLTGPTNPAQIEQKRALSTQQVDDVAAQARQAMQKDYGETAIYPSKPQQGQSPTQAVPETQIAPQETAQPRTWNNVAAEMAEHPQVQETLTRRKEQIQTTLEQAQQGAESTAQQQRRLEERQSEADTVAGQMRQAAATTPDEQVQERAKQWLGQGGSFNEQASAKQETLATAHAQTQAAVERAQERRAALPDTGEMAERMAESPQLKETINAEVAPDFEKRTASMMAQYQERRAVGQADIEKKRSEAHQILAQHEVQQQANLANIQTRAQEDVAQIKQAWQASNETVMDEYQARTGQARQQGNQTIAKTVAQGEQEADQVLTEAEGEADQTKSAGEANAATTVSEGHAKANAIRASVPEMKEGKEEEHAKAKEEAEKKAQQQIQSAEDRAQELLDQMEADVQAILDDANLTAAEKVQQVNDIVEQTITDVNAIMEEERDNAIRFSEELQARMTCVRIKARLDEAVAEVSESMLEDEVVAARVEEIKEAIRDGTGNILIDASSLDDGSYPGSHLAATFRQRMINCLDTLMTRPAGLEIIMQIMDDTETVTITADETTVAAATPDNFELARERADGTAGPGSNTVIRIHPDLGDDDIVVYGDEAETEEIPAPLWLILGHELIHAAHNSAGHNAQAKPWVTHPNYGTLEEERTIATGDLTENDLREQFGIDGPRHGHGGRNVDDLQTDFPGYYSHIVG